MADRTDRRDYREDLGSALSTALTGEGNPVHTVYDHAETNFDGRSPFVSLAVTGTTPLKMTTAGYRYQHHIDLLVYVVRSDGAEAADDTLDDVYLAIADYVEANQTTDNWKRLAFDTQRSLITPAGPGGDDYWLETIPVVVEGY